MSYFRLFIATLLVGVVSFSLLSSVAVAQTHDMDDRQPSVLRTITPEMRARIAARLAEKKDLQVALHIPDSQEEEAITHHDYPHFAMEHIDTMAVQEARLGWINAERASLGVAPLELDTMMMASSIEWANHLAANKQFSNLHRRPGQTVYYSMDEIMGRVKRLGLIDDTVSMIAESTMRGSANFTSTDTMIASTRGRTGGPSGFLGFLMGEKRHAPGSWARSHYDMMTSPAYTKVGFGFANAGKHPRFPSRGSQYMGVIHFTN